MAALVTPPRLLQMVFRHHLALLIAFCPEIFCGITHSSSLPRSSATGPRRPRSSLPRSATGVKSPRALVESWGLATVVSSDGSFEGGGMDHRRHFGGLNHSSTLMRRPRQPSLAFQRFETVRQSLAFQHAGGAAMARQMRGRRDTSPFQQELLEYQLPPPPQPPNGRADRLFDASGDTSFSRCDADSPDLAGDIYKELDREMLIDSHRTVDGLQGELSFILTWVFIVPLLVGVPAGCGFRCVRSQFGRVAPGPTSIRTVTLLLAVIVLMMVVMIYAGLGICVYRGTEAHTGLINPILVDLSKAFLRNAPSNLAQAIKETDLDVFNPSSGHDLKIEKFSGTLSLSDMVTANIEKRFTSDVAINKKDKGRVPLVFSVVKTPMYWDPAITALARLRPRSARVGLILNIEGDFGGDFSLKVNATVPFDFDCLMPIDTLDGEGSAVRLTGSLLKALRREHEAGNTIIDVSGSSIGGGVAATHLYWPLGKIALLCFLLTFIIVNSILVALHNILRRAGRNSRFEVEECLDAYEDDLYDEQPQKGKQIVSSSSTTTLI